MSPLSLQALDALGERDDDFGQLADQLREADVAINAKAVWGGALRLLHTDESTDAADAAPVDSVNND